MKLTPEEQEQAMYNRYGAGLGFAGQAAQQAGASGAVSSTLSGAGAGFTFGGPVGAAVGAGVGLVSGVLGDKAKAEAEKRQNYLNALKTELNMKTEAQKEYAQGMQNSFNQQLSGFGKALG